MSPRVRFVRATTFSAAHRYFDPLLSEIENQKLYGSLYRQDGFGHNFAVEAHLEGEIDPLTGMICNLREIDTWLKSVVGALDHKDLNRLTAFQGVSPTPERVVQHIFKQLQLHLERHVAELRKAGDPREIRLVKVRLHEGDNLWVDCLS